MKLERYTTIAGETLKYPRPSASIASFIAHVAHSAHDPSVSEGELIELIYGKSNPLLDQTIFPGRGAVTRAVFKNPLYHVLQDLLEAKRMQVGTVAKDVYATFTLTVAEAADQLSVTPGAVRQAIAAGTLVAVKRGSAYFIDRRSVARYRKFHIRRGPTAKTRTRRARASG